MNSQSKMRLAVILALSGSAVLHVAAMAIAPDNRAIVQIEGGEATEMAALGSSFADLVKAGDKFEPVTTEDDARPVVTEAIDAATPTETLSPVEPQTKAAVPMTDLAPSPDPQETASPQPASTRPVETEPVSQVVATARPRQTTPKPARIEPVKPAETITAMKEPRPAPKPIPKPKQQPKPVKKKPVSAQKSANSTVDAKAGSQQGKATAKAAPSGNAQAKSAKTGSAAASNYPGKVYSKIARTRQRSTGGRGVAHVSFQITPSGQVAGVSVSRSSGNSSVDRAAVAHVKRASPFPKPPAGARTSFVIPIEFRR